MALWRGYLEETQIACVSCLSESLRKERGCLRESQHPWTIGKYAEITLNRCPLAVLSEMDEAAIAWVQYILDLSQAEAQGALGVYISRPSARTTHLLRIARHEKDAIAVAWAKWYHGHPPRG